MVDLRHEVTLLGEPVELVLELSSWGQVAPLAIDPTQRSESSLASATRTNLSFSVARLAGRSLGRSAREKLESDPTAVATVLAKRYDLYGEVRAAGRMYAQCPHCLDGEIEMSLLALFDVLGAMPPPMISDDFRYLLELVSDASSRTPVRHAAHTYAARIRFELPTYRLGLPRAGIEGGVLRRGWFQRTVPLRNKWDTDGVNAPLETSWHAAHRQVYLSSLWLVAAIQDPAIDLPDLEQLPAVDVYYLDALYRLAFDTDVPEHAHARTCPSCARDFVPVAPLVYDYLEP